MHYSHVRLLSYREVPYVMADADNPEGLAMLGMPRELFLYVCFSHATPNQLFSFGNVC